MKADQLIGFIQKFSERRALVVGDLVADQFIYGEISRISREAPVLILRHERTETVPGGAANCALNLAALGARVTLVGCLGKDAAGAAVRARLLAAGVDCSSIVAAPSGRTTTKVRVLAGGTHSTRQQVIRIDYDERLPESQTNAGDGTSAHERLIAELHAQTSAAPVVDLCIVSDYNYGVANAEVIAELRRLKEERSVPVIVDSRFRLHELAGFTSATPNEDEVEGWSGRRLTNDAELVAASIELRRALNLQSLLVTRGKQGMLLIADARPPRHIPSIGANDAVDVTGAGDSVIATYALALASGADIETGAQLANHAGGIVVMKRGTATLTANELTASVRQHETHNGC